MEIHRERINNWECAILQGPFIVNSTQEVHDIINEVKEWNDPLLVIDISNVPFMDSSAIGVLLSGTKTLKKIDGQLVVFGANEVIMEVFNAVQLPRHIPVFQDRNDFITYNC